MKIKGDGSAQLTIIPILVFGKESSEKKSKKKHKIKIKIPQLAGGQMQAGVRTAC
jgi:hypothetical protein